MFKKILSMALAVVLCLGLVPSALAYNTPDFSDLPSDNWAYGPVMRMADQGIIQGTGEGKFSPTMKVSVAQFLTLVGRIVFPDTAVGVGDTWYGPYVAAVQANGLLTGAQVDVNLPEAEITRYDMAVVLRAAAKKLGKTETLAQQSQVTDFGTIPNMYTEAVLAVYGMGLITGDQNGNFNGSNTMMRNELATVIDRLVALKVPGGPSTDPGATTNPEKPTNAEYTLEVLEGGKTEGVMVPGERTSIRCLPSSYKVAPYGSSHDRTGFTCISSNPSVVEITGTDGWNWFVTAIGAGSATVTCTDPYGVSGTMNITVVAQRENIGTKTYMVRVDLRSQKHTIRGDAYTETTYLFDTPFEVYYTRDGGKTSQLIAEGRTPVDDGRFRNSTAELEIALPEDAFYSEDAGLYVSTEAELDGQRIVTSDLRTDGRTNIRATQQISEVKNTQGNIESRIPITATLTPPEGEKSHFTFKGYVMGDQREIVGGATVRLYHKDGFLIGETTSRENGTFEMECEVDALDGGFDKREALYRVVAWGYAGEVYGAVNGIRADGSLVLESLVDLEVASAFNSDSPGGQNYRLIIYWGATPINPE